MQNIKTDSINVFTSEDLFGIGSFLSWRFIEDVIAAFLAIQKLDTNTFLMAVSTGQEGFSLKTHYRVVFTRLI